MRMLWTITRRMTPIDPSSPLRPRRPAASRSYRPRRPMLHPPKTCPQPRPRLRRRPRRGLDPMYPSSTRSRRPCRCRKRAAGRAKLVGRLALGRDRGRRPWPSQHRCIRPLRDMILPRRRLPLARVERARARVWPLRAERGRQSPDRANPRSTSRDSSRTSGSSRPIRSRGI